MSEKKSERLEVRLGYQEKSDFVDACDTQGDTPSSALRRFIRGYVRRADGDVLSSALRGATRRRGWGLAAAAGVIAVMLAGAFIAFNGPPAPLTDSEIFAARDLNGDGELGANEHGLPETPTGEPNGVMRVLDLDWSGTISRAEFVATGRMVFALQTTEVGVFPEGEPAMTLVQFTFDEIETRSGTFAVSAINAGEMDRFVIWYADDSNAVFEDDVEINTDGDFTVLSDTATFPASVNVQQEDGETTATRNKPE